MWEQIPNCSETQSMGWTYYRAKAQGSVAFRIGPVPMNSEAAAIEAHQSMPM
jgi:hypothetical protein